MQLNRPRPLALFFFVLCFGTTMALGTWQIQRLQWKTKLIAEIEAAKSQPPISIDAYEENYDDLPKDDASLEALNFHPLCIEGGWVEDEKTHRTIEFHISPRFFHGVLGYFVVSPLQFGSEEAGFRTILVNRGWVPADKKEPETRPESLVEGAEGVCGLLRTGDERNYFTPPSAPERNLWFGRDIAQMAAFAKLEHVVPAMLDVVGEQDVKQLPVPSDGTIRLTNDHLSYIITWYGIALGILVIFILTLRKKS